MTRAARFIISASIGLMLILGLVVLAKAGQNERSIVATGVLRDNEVVVSAPTELAVLSGGMNLSASTLPSSVGKQSQGLPVQGSLAIGNPDGRAQTRQVAGRVVEALVSPGDTVNADDALLVVDDAVARANLDAAQARYDVVTATIEQLTGVRSDLSDKGRELNETEADLRLKRIEADRRFKQKHSDGKTKLAELKRNLETVSNNLNTAQAGLAQTKKAELEAQRRVEMAQALPDSNPSKQKLLAQANAMLQGARQKKAELSPVVAQLSAAKAKLQTGMYAANNGLTKGLTQFNAGMRKIDSALIKIDDGRQNISDGATSVSRKIIVLQKRQNQADVGVFIAKRILDATTVKANRPGIVRDLRLAQGSVLYPGQPIMSIVSTERLKLDIFVPVEDIAQVKRGDRVEVKVDASPGATFDGKVVSVAGKTGFAPSNMATQELELLRVVKVTVEVINKDRILKAGMPADVIIH